MSRDHAGVVIRYDEAQGRATIRLRIPLRRGDAIEILGPNTKCGFNLKAPRLLGHVLDRVSGEQLVDVLTPAVEPGDVVYRITNHPALSAPLYR